MWRLEEAHEEGGSSVHRLQVRFDRGGKTRVGADDGKEGRMNDPVHIFGTYAPEKQEEALLTMEDRAALDKLRFERRMQVGIMIFLGVVALGLLSPLVILLARLAGGW
jgi:hypothetical protein